jgi:3-phosphoshikimate 1-carboxyvinyltransferase
MNALRALGVEIEDEGDVVRVHGVGLRGLRSPGEPIDCGNAGTLVRLLSGLLAGHEGQEFELTGDDSLRSRPMERIAEPLRRMGAQIETTEGRLPMRIEGRPLAGISYELPVASAQVKSAVLLAGLYASGETAVIEPLATRDHTERMLSAMGAAVHTTPKLARIQPVDRLEPLALEIPGDFSSAAPFIVAAALLQGSELVVAGVGMNPARTGLLTVLERMGARVSVFNRRLAGGEPVADLEVTHAPLTATTVAPEEVPLLVDELPLFALAAGMARGTSEVRGAQELREKETDRIETVSQALRRVGVHLETRHDGLKVQGTPARPRGGVVESQGDHRIAMLGAIAGLVSREGVRIQGPEAASVSFPGFYELLDRIAIRDPNESGRTAKA